MELASNSTLAFKFKLSAKQVQRAVFNTMRYACLGVKFMGHYCMRIDGIARIYI